VDEKIHEQHERQLMPLPWAAMGIGALIGGLTSKQRGGNFLKGALQGAALGGATGILGGGIGKFKGFGGGEGMFGWGKKLLPNFLAGSGIVMGSEMMGQSEANRLQMERQRRWLDEEEERRIARLSRIAGYDVADSANFMTPQSYFSARGGYKTRPQYQFGGISSLEDDPAEAVDIQELQMDPGTMGPGELTEEFDFMEEAGSGGDESGWYEMFFNEFGRPPVDINELQLFIDQSDISPTDVARGAGQGPMMAAEGGRVHAKGGIYLGPDDELEDDDRYDEELLEILGDEGAMFHADYDVADEWKKGGHINRPGYAPGGITDLDLRGGGASFGPGTGTSDDIPAMLSDGEFVVTANAVKNLGGGDRMEGARRMYSMMNQLDPQSQSPAEMSGAGYA